VRGTQLLERSEEARKFEIKKGKKQDMMTDNKGDQNLLKQQIDCSKSPTQTPKRAPSTTLFACFL
jgi:hypothetical protein